jgi:hypothetical protein
MGVSVIGVDYENVDGLAASLDLHRKSHRDNGDMILNLRDAAGARKEGRQGPRKSDARPAYQHRAFPMHTYHADGRVREVNSADELKLARLDGFRAEQYAVVRVAPKDPAEEKAILEAKLREGDGKLAMQNELLLKLSARLEALEAEKAAAEPPPAEKPKGKQ